MGGPNSTSRLFPLRALAVVALAGMMLLSGCAGKSNKKGATAPSDVVDPTYDDTTGAIHGTVLNEELIPLAGVDVGIQSDRLSTTTSNAAGEFGFSQVAPGDYVLLASQLGYADASKTIKVKAGEVTDVQLDLVAQAVAGRPYAKVIGPLPGKFFCGFSAVIVAGPCVFMGAVSSEEAYQNMAAGENNIFEMADAVDGNKSNPDDKLGAVVLEVTWTATQGAARTLQASIEMTDPQGRNATETIDWAGGSGASPLKVVAEPGKLNAGAYNRVIDADPDNAVMPPDATGFTIGVFPAGDADGPTVLWPLTPAAYTEQPFQVWLSLIYNQTPRADYTALAT